MTATVFKNQLTVTDLNLDDCCFALAKMPRNMPHRRVRRSLPDYPFVRDADALAGEPGSNVPYYR